MNFSWIVRLIANDKSQFAAMAVVTEMQFGCGWSCSHVRLVNAWRICKELLFCLSEKILYINKFL